MAKILAVGGFGAGHVNPMLPIVRHWMENDDEVHFFCTEDMRQKVEAAGITFKAYPSFIDGQAQGEINFFQFVIILLKSADIILPVVLEEAAKHKYDFVFHDSLFGWGKLISHILKIPHIASHASFASSSETKKAPSAEPGLGKGGVLLEEIGQLAEALGQKYGVPAPTIPEVFSQWGDLNLVYTSRYFQPRPETLDDSYAFVGPVISTRQDPNDFPFYQLDDRPLVYISMGTVVSKGEDFFRLCLEAFPDPRFQVIVSAGKKADLSFADEAPDHFIFRSHIPQLDILKRTSVFVTHGGMNSTSEALYFNIPLVVIPHGADQPQVAARVTGLGAGIKLSPRNLTAESLRSAVDELMETAAYKTSAETIGLSLREAGGVQAALEEADRFRRLHGIPSGEVKQRT
ncbi:macrolide family glycosyltransferase [Paenibacillus herberti]|uniref:Erythromycin biosynthesis protein CIII-like C-terminal domain-containing protein n=1 Tax=Paenibacillus herberti TaxID=1619309 RepID=A0A229P3B8_9BACL|nr:macrolide family glycosyltransferase [Paenibacillus herberti]OXM16369.1 hypothetical protein CGZ75_06715 [Paenibacillus herberti]